jgi:hypothetical protein
MQKRLKSSTKTGHELKKIYPYVYLVLFLKSCIRNVNYTSIFTLVFNQKVCKLLLQALCKLCSCNKMSLGTNSLLIVLIIR